MPATLTSRTSPERARHKRTPEFMIYFAILFTLTLPFAVVAWARQSITERSFASPGPIARARSEADCITPIIFSK